MKFKDVMLTILVIIAIINLYLNFANYTMLYNMGNKNSNSKDPIVKVISVD